MRQLHDIACLPSSSVTQKELLFSAQQFTLLSSLSIEGVGLHTGKKITLTMKPAVAGTGIVFIRCDLKDRKKSLIHASWEYVSSTELCTEISNEYGVSVKTIEHLMAAFVGYGIDNAIVELDGIEVPALDGSAQPWFEAMEAVGRVSCQAGNMQEVIRVLRPISLENKQAGWAIVLEPSDYFSIDMQIDFGHKTKAIGRQSFCAEMSSNIFKKEVAAARTFGFIQDIKYLQNHMNLALGASESNGIAVDGKRVLNKEKLRFHNEFVRHKVLDLMGDLFLAGKPLLCKVFASCSGHEANNKILRKLFSDPNNWRLDYIFAAE